MPAFFAYDLNKYLKKETNKIIVIFLDTYEALWNQTKNDITKFSQDQFVRELISQLPGVLFVISGREYLDWKQVDPDWNNYLKQYEIKTLEDTDVDLFLTNCGIKESDIRKKMQSISMGVPYHLDLLVDTYIEMKNKNIVPHVELFANNARDILECFFKFLHEEEIAVIKIISIPRFYTFDLFKYLLILAVFAGIFTYIGLNYNRGNNVINEKILSRLIITDGELSGDNRTSMVFDKYYDNWLKHGDIFNGYGRKAYGDGNATSNILHGCASFKRFFFINGIIGTVLICLLYLCLYLRYRSKQGFGFFLVVIICNMIRDYPYRLMWMFLFVLGITAVSYTHLTLPTNSRV